MGDQIVDVDFALHVPVDDFRHVGAAARAEAALGDAYTEPAADVRGYIGWVRSK